MKLNVWLPRSSVSVHKWWQKSSCTMIVKCPSRFPSSSVVCEWWCHPDRFLCLFRPAYAAVLASLAVDLYPLALHVSLCDPAGRPGGRERLVLTSHHVHVRDMLADVLDSSRLQRMSRGLSMTAATSPQEVGLFLFFLALREQRFWLHRLFEAVCTCGFPCQLRRLCAISSPQNQKQSLLF